MNEMIAETILLGVTRAGEEINIVIGIGYPKVLVGEPAECMISLAGIESKPIKIYGADTLQVLCLAIRHTRFLVGEFIKYGGRLYYPEDEVRTELSAEVLFPSHYPFQDNSNEPNP